MFIYTSEPYVTEEELKLMLRGAELSGAIEEEEQVISIGFLIEINYTLVKKNFGFARAGKHYIFYIIFSYVFNLFLFYIKWNFNNRAM